MDPLKFIKKDVLNSKQTSISYARSFDKNCDGKFTKEEFDNAVMSSVTQATQFAISVFGLGKKIDKIFDEMDKADIKDGYVSFDDLRAYLAAMDLEFDEIKNLRIKDSVPAIDTGIDLYRKKQKAKKSK